jgi:trimeric autotransporter adhesin
LATTAYVMGQGYAKLASPTFTGTVSGITATMVGLGNVTNESKATMFTSPTFTGTVTGVTATHVGLSNVTNESKATMFSSPTFTGTVTMPTTAHGNSPISGIKWAAFNGEYNAGSGTAITPDFANGQKQYCTMGSGTTTVTLNTGSFPGVGHFQLRIIQYSTAGALAFAGTAYSASRWLNDADANDVNSANNGESILSLYWNGTNAYLSMGKVGAA